MNIAVKCVDKSRTIEDSKMDDMGQYSAYASIVEKRAKQLWPALFVVITSAAGAVRKNTAPEKDVTSFRREK